jgi:hypothetical protein
MIKRLAKVLITSRKMKIKEKTGEMEANHLDFEWIIDNREYLLVFQ